MTLTPTRMASLLEADSALPLDVSWDKCKWNALLQFWLVQLQYLTLKVFQVTTDHKGMQGLPKIDV